MYHDIWKKEALKSKEEQLSHLPEIETTLMYVGQIPQQLFSEPHPIPQRFSSTNTSCKNQKLSTRFTYQIEINGKLLSSYISSKQIISIDEEGNKITTELESIPQLSKTSNRSRRISSLKNYLQDIDHPVSTVQKIPDFQSIYKPSENGINEPKIVFPKKTIMIIIGSVKNDIACVMLNKLEIFNVTCNHNEVVAISSDVDLLAIADSDAYLSVYNLDNKAKGLKTPLFSIQTYRDSIKCVAVSQTFHSVICGTRDSSILLFSINNSCLVKRISLDGKVPTLALITAVWSFTLIQTKMINQGQHITNLSLYDVNLDFIQEIKLNISFIKWISFKSKSGFDYVLACDENNDVFCFEAYYLEIGTPIHKSKNKIISLSFLENEEAIIIIEEDGNTCFIPFNS